MVVFSTWNAPAVARGRHPFVAEYIFRLRWSGSIVKDWLSSDDIGPVEKVEGIKWGGEFKQNIELIHKYSTNNHSYLT